MLQAIFSGTPGLFAAKQIDPVAKANFFGVLFDTPVTASGKEQELPSLYAQRATFDALGVVQSFRDYVEYIIAYYESQ